MAAINFPPNDVDPNPPSNGDTYSPPGLDTVYTYENGVWTGGVAAGQQFMPLGGGNFTGNVTFDTDKIFLGVNGNADFSGDVTIDGNLALGSITDVESAILAATGGTPSSISDGSATLNFTGNSILQSNTGYQPTLTNSYDLGAPTLTWKALYSNAIVNTTSLDNTGDVRIGGSLPNSPNITLSADGNGLYAGYLQSGAHDTSDGLFQILTGTKDAAEETIRFIESDTSTRSFIVQADGTIKLGGNAGSSPNITLAAAGDITTTSLAGSGTVPVNVDAAGKLVRGSSTSNDIWVENNAQIYPADANDSLLIGGTLPGSPNITLNADGSGIFKPTTTDGVALLWDSPGATSGVGARAFAAEKLSDVVTGADSDESFTVAGFYQGAATDAFYLTTNVAQDVVLAGDLHVGSPTADASEAYATPQIILKNDGSATFTDTVAAPSFFGDNIGDSQIWYGGAGTSIIKADGTASFASNLQVGATDADSTNPGGYIYSTRYIDDDNRGSAALNGQSTDGDLASLIVIDRSDTGGGSETVIIKPDGSATFASGKCSISNSGAVVVERSSSGVVFRAGEAGQDPSCEIISDGSAEFGGYVVVDRDAGKDPNTACFAVESGDDTVARINDDGSATFDGPVSSGNVSSTTAFSQLIPGSVQARPEVFSDITFAGYATSGSDPVFSVNGVGAATFDGQVECGGDDTTYGVIGKNSAIGGNTFQAGGLFQNYTAGGSAIAVIPYNYVSGAAATAYIKEDGSATFGTATILSTGVGTFKNTTSNIYTFISSTATKGNGLFIGTTDAIEDTQIFLEADGNATFAQTVLSQQVNNSGYFFQGKVGNNSLFEVQADGQLALRDTSGTANVSMFASTGQATFNSRVSGTVNSIPDDGAWDMVDSNFWDAAGGTIVNPSSTTPGQTGVIFATAEISAWGTYFKFPGGNTPTVPANSVIPYYIETQNVILMGNATEAIA